MKNHEAVGFIDSGVGGLTVIKEAMKQLPNERLIYLGDTARCPYGSRPAEQVIKYTWEMTQFLLDKKIKMLVIACNTATAVALDEIKKTLPIPVVGVILPGVRAALKATENNAIGVIGTTGTIKSRAYETALKNKVPKIIVSSLACPEFVPLVEKDHYHSPLAKKIVSKNLQPLKLKKLDTLILGCTHYPLLRPIIQNVMGKEVQLIDSGAETISEVSMLLDYFDIANPAKYKNLPNEFYTTGSVDTFHHIAENWLQVNDLEVASITLGGK